MNKNTRRLIYSIVVLIVIGVITAVLGTMPVKNGLESLEKAGWFALFFIITIVVAIVVFVNIVICLVAEELVEENGGKTMYKYEKTDWEKLPMERSNIGGMEQYENAENHSLFI